MKINGIVVVEGKSDIAFLSNFIDAEFVITNGSDIPSDTIAYLKQASKNKEIYVLTDPDYPGERIRKILDENIDGLQHCFVNKEHSINNGKVGVAESTKEEVEKALANAVKTSKENKGTLTMEDLMNLCLTGCDDSSIKRDKVSKAFNLGHCNAKVLLKRLNYCGINIDDIKKAL